MGTAVKYISALGLALAAAAALVGLAAARRSGAVAYEAAAVAALVNWIAGSLALATVVATRNKPYRIHGAMLAMGARMALPLVAIVYFTETGHPLTKVGVVGSIVALYLVGLALETVMTVRLVSTTGVSTSDRLPSPPTSHTV